MTNINQPRVAVQILAWNQVDEVITCLKSFSCIKYHNYEVILVDNGSDDNTVEVVKRDFPWVTIIENKENLGFCKGNNIGLRYCLEKGFDYVLLLNSDIKVLPNLIDELVKVMQSDSKIGIAGAKNLLLENPDYMWGQYGKVTWGPMLVKTIGRLELNMNHNDTPKDVDWVICNGCMVNRTALEKVGGFDEEFWQCMEDVDWSYRARKAGFRIVYVDTTAILHKGSSSADLSREKIFNYGYFIGRNTFTFAKKHATSVQMIKLFLMVWIGLLGRVAYGIADSIMGQRHFLFGVMDGLLGRQRPSEFIINNVFVITKQKTPSQKPSPGKPTVAKPSIQTRIKKWIGI